MALYIRDITVEVDENNVSQYKLSYEEKYTFVSKITFDTIYDSVLDQTKLYKIIKHEFFRTNNMMYDEYFGTDDNSYQHVPHRLAPSTPTTVSQIAARQAKSKLDVLRNKENNIKIENRNKLGGTFWGNLIVQDVLNGNG